MLLMHEGTSIHILYNILYQIPEWHVMLDIILMQVAITLHVCRYDIV